LQSTVKKWLRDKEFGFLENGNGPDILVRKTDLQNCQFLKVGVLVEFECHADKRGLIAKQVRLIKSSNGQNSSLRKKEHYFGVMT